MDHLKQITKIRESLSHDKLQVDSIDSPYRRDFLVCSANKLHLLGNTTRMNDRDFYQQVLYYSSMAKLDRQCLVEIGEDIEYQGDLSFLDDVPEKPVIFCSFHIGSFHSLAYMLGKSGISFSVVVSQQAYYRLYKPVATDLNRLKRARNFRFRFDMLNIGSPNVGLRMIRKLKAGSSLLIYLDGYSGSSGKLPMLDKNQLEVKLLNGKIFVHKNIAAISHLAGAAIAPVISYREKQDRQDRIHVKFLPPIRPDSAGDREAYVCNTTRKLFRHFGHYLKAYPTQWEGWLYVHQYLDTESLNGRHEEPLIYLDRPQIWKFNRQRYELFVKNGHYYLFNKYSYLVVQISHSVYRLLHGSDQENGQSRPVERELFRDLIFHKILTTETEKP